MPLDLSALKAQAEKDLEIAAEATEGPWETDTDNEIVMREDGEFIINDEGFLVDRNRTENIKFIAHARAALPASAQAVLKLCEEIKRLQKTIAIFLDEKGFCKVKVRSE